MSVIPSAIDLYTAAGQAQLSGLISQFNAFYAKTPNRADLSSMLTIYNNIKKNYIGILTAAQKTGLDGKLFAYEDKLRKIEAGTATATPTGTITILPGQTITPLSNTLVTVPATVAGADTLFTIGTYPVTTKTAMIVGLLASVVGIVTLSGSGKKR